MTIELLVKEYRLQKDLSIRDLEKLSNVNRATISRIETNKSYYPSIYTVCKIAIALKIPLEDLVKFRH